MALLLSMIAMTGAIVTGVAAWRARAASHRLALEMVHLRDRLAEAEAARVEAEARATARPSPTADDTNAADRIGALEQRLQAVAARDATLVTQQTEGEDLRSVIERRLRSEGFERIAFLESIGDDTVVVEAERNGLMTKGRAVLRPDGSVQMRSVSNVRAFP